MNTFRWRCAAILLVGVVLLLAGAIRWRMHASERRFTLGTNGTFVANFDKQNRVTEFRQLYPDGRLKLSAKLQYGHRDLRHIVIYDSEGECVQETTFNEASTTTSSGEFGRRSPDGQISYENRWSGTPGDINDIHTWSCSGGVLYRIMRRWHEDQSTVSYVVTGPSDIVLFTNSYREK
jgi:hypothetical protein